MSLLILDDSTPDKVCKQWGMVCSALSSILPQPSLPFSRPPTYEKLNASADDMDDTMDIRSGGGGGTCSRGRMSESQENGAETLRVDVACRMDVRVLSRMQQTIQTHFLTIFAHSQMLRIWHMSKGHCNPQRCRY